MRGLSIKKVNALVLVIAIVLGSLVGYDPIIVKSDGGSEATVDSFVNLQNAIENGYSEITVTSCIKLSDGDTLDGRGCTVKVNTPYVNDNGEKQTETENKYSGEVFNIADDDATVTLKNMTIMGGKGDGAVINQGYLTMNNVTITQSNRGLYNTGKAILIDCHLRRNLAGYGGGLFNTGEIVVDECSFIENSDLEGTGTGSGGGGAADNRGTMYINNTVMYNNISNERGSAVINKQSNASTYIMNSTICGNVAVGQSNFGALCNDAGKNLYVVNSIITDNKFIRENKQVVIASDIISQDCNWDFSVVGDKIEDDEARKNIFADYDENKSLKLSGIQTTGFVCPKLKEGYYYLPILETGMAGYGGTKTYFDHNICKGTFNVKMSYDNDGTKTSLGQGEEAQNQVSKYFERTPRKEGVIGASGWLENDATDTGTTNDLGEGDGGNNNSHTGTLEIDEDSDPNEETIVDEPISGEPSDEGTSGTGSEDIDETQTDVNQMPPEFPAENIDLDELDKDVEEENHKDEELDNVANAYSIVTYDEKDLENDNEIDKSSWGTKKEVNGIVHYIDDDGKTSVEVPARPGTVWLQEESNGTSTWYGFDNTAEIFEPGSRAYVQWLSKGDPGYEELLANIDPFIKLDVEGEKLWIFRVGVSRPNGERYSNIDSGVNLYVQIGDDWNENELQGYYVREAEDEFVETTFTSLTCPNGEKRFGVLKLKHFSPYLIYDKFTENDVEKTENTDQSDKSSTLKTESTDTAKVPTKVSKKSELAQRETEVSEESDEDLAQCDKLLEEFFEKNDELIEKLLEEDDEFLDDLFEEADESENVDEKKTPIKPTSDLHSAGLISILDMLNLISVAYLIFRKKKLSQI